MPKVVMTQEKLNLLRNLQKEGKRPAEIVEILCLPYYTCSSYISGRSRNVHQITVVAKKEKPERITNHEKWWTEDEIKMLQEGFKSLPTYYRHSNEFVLLCEKLKRTTNAVYAKITDLGLIKPNFTRALAPDPIRKVRRHPPVYTNTRTPLGLADMLHAGNRIY